LYRAKQRITK